MITTPPNLANNNRRDSRILIVANSTTDSSLTALLAEQPKDAQIVVVAPALTSRLNYWSSDDRRSRRAAQQRVDDVLAELTRLGYYARGRVGDADPLQAVADALHFFPAERIIVASPPEKHANWRARNLVPRLRARFQVEVVDVAMLPHGAVPMRSRVRRPASRSHGGARRQDVARHEEALDVRPSAGW